MISNSPVFGKLNQLSPEPPEGIELPLNAPRRVQVLRIMSLAGLTDGQQKPVARYSPRQKLCLMAQRFAIRLAGLSDAALIATQRARMFQEMGLMPEALFEALSDEM